MNVLNKYLIRQSMLLAACCLMLAGCSSSTKELEAWVAEVKSRPAPPLDPLPVMKQFETFEYSAQNLRDPFSVPLTERNANNGPRPDSDRRKEAMEAYPLDSLDMVGTIGTPGNFVGLVLAPDKVTYRLRVGNYIGQNDGRITGVYEDRIEMTELVPDGAGGWTERQAKLALDDK